MYNDIYYNDDYEKKSLLGRGSYGKVFLVEEKETRKRFTMKIVDIANENDIEDLIHEVNFLKKLGSSHPNIPRYEGSFYDNTKHAFVILTEYCSKVSSATIISNYKK